MHKSLFSIGRRPDAIRYISALRPLTQARKMPKERNAGNAHDWRGARLRPGVYFTPPTMKPSASSAARTLATWSPWTSMVRSLTRTAGAACRAQFLGHFLDDGGRQMCRKIIDHHDRLSTAMGGFSPEQNAAHFPDGFSRGWPSRVDVFSCRNVQILKCWS
jgi:hypothetical protein